MEWSSTGYVLSVKKHGETSVIIDVLTRDRGRHAGLVRGGVSKRLRAVLQPGNKLQLEWHSRLSENLGIFKVEALTSRAAEVMEDRVMLSALNAMTAMVKENLPEREAHTHIYDAFEVLLNNLEYPEIWPILYVKWEAGLLQSLGYGLDFSACAATGSNDQLTHVSPRSGRAVSASAAEPYLDKLYKLPPFMMGSTYATPDDIANGLALTGYFLETRLAWGVNRTLPEARAQMIARLIQEGHASALAPRL